MVDGAILEAELGCKECNHLVGKAWRKEIREGIWEHWTEPAKIPKYCSMCNHVIMRMK